MKIYIREINPQGFESVKESIFTCQSFDSKQRKLLLPGNQKLLQRDLFQVDGHSVNLQRKKREKSILPVYFELNKKKRKQLISTSGQ